MTMLTLVQDFCGRTGLPEPATVYGTTDPQVRQIRRLLEEEGDDLVKRGSWEGSTFEATHTSLAAEDQGAITSIATNGFLFVKNETIWDRTDRLPILGPLNGKDWQAVKGFNVSGPRYRYRIRGGKLLANPIPTAGHTWAFEYGSKNFILGVDGTTYKRRFTADTDNPLLPEELMLMGLRWRWKKEKGFDYAEDFRTYEGQVKDALGRDGGKKRLSMDAECRAPAPGVFIPEGSWDL